VSPLANGVTVPARVAQVQRTAFIAGGVGLALGIVCALINTDLRVQFFRSYLWAFTYWLGIPLGCLVILMIQYLTGGAWGFALRRLLEAATRTLPLLALLFVPLAFGLKDIYIWADQAAVDADPNLQHKAEFYLRTDLALMRVSIYFAVWIGLAFLLNRWSRQEDASETPQDPRRFRLLSAPGIGLYGLTMTFAAIDWVMSLEPHWYSTIYGPMFGMGQVVSGMTFVLVVAMLLRDEAPLTAILSPHVLRDCGNLLLAFVMLWTYMAFSQFLLIWSGNLPEEIPWYLLRSEGGWQFVAIALAVFHFAVPFVLLLSRDYKQDPRRLAGISFLLLGMEALNLLWLIMPSFGAHEGEGSHVDAGLATWLLGPASLVGVGGIWVGVFLWQLGKRPLLPLHAPNGEEAASHG
jgi:hypothetical protein